MASSATDQKQARWPRPMATAADQAQTGEFLTTAQGLRLPDTDHSLKAGERGPTLLEDFHLREKITHFDHERIPERVVHARGAAAHGVFESYGTARVGNQGRVPGRARASRPRYSSGSLPSLGSRGLGGHRPGHPRVRGEVLHR